MTYAQYGTIQANTVINFGGWAPSGTQSNVEIHLTIANTQAVLSLPSTHVNAGSITSGMRDSVKLLENYYNTIFSLVQHHKYSLSEVENLIPFERDIYVQMLIKYLNDVEEAKKRQI